MPLNLTTFETSLKKAFSQIQETQADALSQEISNNFIAGQTAGLKHKSIESSFGLVTSQDEEDLTDEDKEELALLLALFLGNLKKFNTTAQAQILSKVKSMSEAGKTQEDIQAYVSDVFEGKESITIDNTGKKKKELYVDKDLKISERDKIISKPFFASIITYASLLAENAAHRAYEAGRKQAYIKQEYNQWCFTGPVDERARPWHVALIGTTYTYGTPQSDYAEKVLREPRCRHRASVYRGDGSDTKPEVWQKLKDDAGLYWSDDKQEWQIN